MSHILKALNKVSKNNLNASSLEDKVKTDFQDQSSEKQTTKQLVGINYQIIFLGILIGMVSIGIYLNYNIFQSLITTQDRMAQLTDNLNSQQDQLNKINTLIGQVESTNQGQTKEFLSTVENLNNHLNNQIQAIRNQSQSQHIELSEIIAQQDNKIDLLTSRYDHLDKNLSNFTDVNSRYIEQLNILKKKIAELKYKEHSATPSDN